MLSDDLRVGGAGGAMFEATYKAFGREFHETLAKQDVQVTRNNREAERRVARGEFPVYFPQQLPYALALKGLPIKMIVPDEGVVYAEKITAADRVLDLSSSVDELVRRVRALSPHIGARAELEGRAVTVWRARVGEDGAFEPLEVQPDGGRRMDYEAWHRGLR